MKGICNMDTNRLTWIKFYKKFATELLSYKNKHNLLIDKLQKVYREIDMKFPKMESDNSVIDMILLLSLGYLTRELQMIIVN